MEKEKKEKNKKKKKGYVVLNTILIVLLLIAFLGIGIAVGTTNVIKEINNNSSETHIGTTTKCIAKSLSIYDDKVIEALYRFNQLGFEPENSYESKLTDLTKKDLIITALKGIKNEQINFCKGSEEEVTIPVTIKDLNDSLKKVVPDGKITIDDIKNNGNNQTSYSVAEYGYTFKYATGTPEEYGIIIKNDKIYIIGPCGHEGPYPTNIVSQTEKAELVNDKLFIYQKVAFGKTVYSEDIRNLVVDYYREKEYTNKIDSVSLAETPDMKKFNTFKITFKKNKDQYYFESSEVNK